MSRRLPQPRPAGPLDLLHHALDRTRAISAVQLLGSPLVPLPGHVLDAVVRAAGRTGYADPAGRLGLRQAIADHLRTSERLDLTATDVVVTSGAMQALDLVFRTLVDGGEVLMPRPGFFIEEMVRGAGGRVRGIPSDPGNGFRPDWAAAARAVMPWTRMLYVNTPVNPTGYVFNADDVEQITRLVAEHDLWLLVDEAHTNYVYPGSEPCPLSPNSPADRTILVRSFSKDYAMAGWRVGYAVAPPAVLRSMVTYLERSTVATNQLGQAAAEAALTGPDGWRHDLAAAALGRGTRLAEALDALPGFACRAPMGGLAVFPAVSQDPDLLADRLVTELGIPALSSREFGVEGHLRLQFGGVPDAVDEAIDRLQHADWSTIDREVRR